MRSTADSLNGLQELESAFTGPLDVHTFIGATALFASVEMRRLLQVAARISATNASVLITGETGCGKELIARAVHHYSPRREQPWIDINCAALPDHLLESELFGYEKGAFSGAGAAKPGLFELANGGTLFLDEIGELDFAMQVKLLRALDGAAYYRLGGTRKVRVDVRVVAATNMDLEAAVEAGTFRRDLYHRLDQARLHVPPLRQRPGDIIPLAVHFLGRETMHRHLSSRALDALENYQWPGNVRELKNVILRAACLAQSEEIGVDDLPENIRPAVACQPAGESTIDELEQRAIYQALSQAGNNQGRAAELLGISRRTLIRRLKAYRNSFGEEEMQSSAQRHRDTEKSADLPPLAHE